MIRNLKYLFFIFGFFCFFPAWAQELEPYIDSSYIVESPVESSERREFGYFDSVPRVVERTVDQEALNKLRNDEAYWYANTEFKPKKKQPEKGLRVQKTNWVDAIFWILLVGGFVALLIWLLSSSNIRLFQKSPAVIEDNSEEPVENIFELNFDKEIEAAVAAKNYRLAVRLLYLQMLRLMADSHLIQYTAEKTNSDYLFQLLNTKYYKDFSRLTRNFDYIWYGKFPLSTESFELMQKEFTNFKQGIG